MRNTENMSMRQANNVCKQTGQELRFVHIHGQTFAELREGGDR